MDKKELSEHIARKIFEVGDEINSPTQRIQFIGGEYPDNEKTQGGMCERALRDFILRTMQND